MKINENYPALKESYLFSDIAKKVAAFTAAHPDASIIRLGIGDVTLPLVPAVVEALEGASHEMGVKETFHGYGPEQGYGFLKDAIRDYYAAKGVSLESDEIFISDGAKSDLGNILDIFSNDNTVLVPDPVYPVYVDTNIMAGRKIVYANANEENDFLPMPNSSVHADIIYICSPNNPTGVIYKPETMEAIASILEKKQKEFGHDIYLVSDEPYRELVYDGNKEDFLTKYYKNTIVGYSFSKSLSLPGERIGYVVVPNEASDAEELIRGIEISNRTLGFVNAPSLIQKAVARCLDEKTDVSFYDENRTMLYDGLTELGFTCIKPEGAFYLWVKSPVDNEEEFVEEGKKLHLLMVKGSAFGCGGFVRLAYCVSHETVKNSLPAFEKLAQVYGLK